MKNTTKKLIAILLSAVMILSLASIAAFAEDGAAPAENKIYFDAKGWSNFSIIYCHIWERGGDSFFSWQSKKEACQKDGDTLYSYDLSKLESSPSISGGLRPDKDYCIIFSTNTGSQTYDTTFGTACIGDTAKITGVRVENPVDSEKQAAEAVWTNNSSGYGPHFAISSIGNIIGQFLCPGETATEVIGDWLPVYYDSPFADVPATLKNACAALNVYSDAQYDDICAYIKAKETDGDENKMFALLKDAVNSVEPPTTEPTTAEPTVAPTTKADDASEYVTAISVNKPSAKKANTIKVTSKTKTVKAKKLKKKAQTVKAITVKNAKGAVSYKKAGGNKKLTVTKTGAIKIKKGTKKGTYKITVKVTAKGNSGFNAATKTVKVIIKVK